MSQFKVTPTSLPGLVRLDRRKVDDSRGFLSRLFCADELGAAGWDGCVAQVNHTATAKKATVRGLHFQLMPHAEIKVVTCVRGAVWDVAVDLRAGSPTFLHWHAEELSAQNHRSLLIPKGFAHGFQTLTDGCELIYLHSDAFAPAFEGGLRADDPRLGIAWPLPIAQRSERDSQHPLLLASWRGLLL